MKHSNRVMYVGDEGLTWKEYVEAVRRNFFGDLG